MRCAGDRAPLQCKAFGQEAGLVLAQDHSRAYIKASLGGYRVRQLRDRGRFRFAGEAARSRSLNPRRLARRPVPPMQWPREAAHGSVGTASFDLRPYSADNK